MSRCLILCLVEETLVTAKPVWSDSISDRLKVNVDPDARALKTFLIEDSLTYSTIFFSHFNQVPVKMSYLHVVSTHLKNNNPVSAETADVVQWFAHY